MLSQRLLLLSLALLSLSPATHALPARVADDNVIATAAAPPDADNASTASAIRAIEGTSGNLRAVFGTPATLATSPALQSLRFDTPEGPGIRPLPAVAADPLVVVSLEPLDEMGRSGRLDSYHVGRWPSDERAATNPVYAPPAGFISVTADNQDTQVSKRFHLRDFLTHDQQGVWPKVLVLQPRLLDKLELVGDELQRRGVSDALHVMSGFRTPQYNALGVGRKGGRARDSRHMYGDASDMIVDADGDGCMDDLNHDGRVNLADAKVLFAAAEAVEAAHPELVGGLSAYPATSAHGPFVHIDARGVRARW